MTGTKRKEAPTKPSKPSSVDDPFKDQKNYYPPDLLKRLMKVSDSTGKSTTRLFVLLQEEHCPYNGNTFKVIGIFNSLLNANKTALVFMSDQYEDFFPKVDDADIDGHRWDHFRSFGYDDINTVQWKVSDSGELSLKAIEGGDGDKYIVRVESHDIISGDAIAAAASIKRQKREDERRQEQQDRSRNVKPSIDEQILAMLRGSEYGSPNYLGL